MRISTQQIYQRGVSSLLEQQEKAMKLQSQISSGVKVQTPSDNPIAAARMELMNQRISITEGLQKNNDMATSSLNLEEGALNNITNTLQRLKELQLQGSNSTYSDEDRKNMAIEASGLLRQLKDAANSTDLNGSYMFSGAKSTVAPISINSSGDYVYNGDSTQRFQGIAENFQIAINDTGDNLFMRIPSGNGSFSIRQPSVPNAGTAVASVGSVVNSATYVPGDYTMNFSAGGSGGIDVSVTDGSTVLFTAPYVDGAAINFNGTEVTVTGAPQAGDSFSITSKDESVFATVQRMIDNFNKPSGSPAASAAIQTENQQLVSQLDNAFNQIVNTHSDVGVRLNQLESAQTGNQNLLLASKETLTQLRDLDMNELAGLATQYNLQLVSLQAAQQSFVRIQGLSVFNYI
jgi:flagellar hook-associated protein 3 FlgL